MSRGLGFSTVVTLQGKTDSLLKHIFPGGELTSSSSYCTCWKLYLSVLRRIVHQVDALFLVCQVPTHEGTLLKDWGRALYNVAFLFSW